MAQKERNKLNITLVKLSVYLWLHPSVSGIWGTDCDRRCLAQVSPSLLSVPCRTLRQSGRGAAWQTARQVSPRAAVMDEAEQDAAPSLPAPLVSYPTKQGDPPPVRSLRDGSVPATRSPVREVVTKEGSHEQETEGAVWRTTERSDGWFMYLQTVQQRKSVTAGAEEHVTGRAGREGEHGSEKWNLGVHL